MYVSLCKYFVIKACACLAQSFMDCPSLCMHISKNNYVGTPTIVCQRGTYLLFIGLLGVLILSRWQVQEYPYALYAQCTITTTYAF